MVEGDHDGDSASITIELLNVIEITSCFFFASNKMLQISVYCDSQNAFQWTHFYFCRHPNHPTGMNSDVLCRILWIFHGFSIKIPSPWAPSEGPKKPAETSDPPQRSPPIAPPAAVRPVPGHPGAAGRRCRPGGGLCRWDGKFGDLG